MDYTWEKLTSREFEIIACNFAHDMFPSYRWKLTTSTRDDNHDFYAEAGFLNKWGEAKHSKQYNKTISRSQWDPTLISAKLINSVNDILLITCAYIPLSYVVRSYHMTVKPINNIYCINRLSLNKWYRQAKCNLSSFNTNISIKSIRNKICVNNTDNLYNNEVKLFIFDDIEKNYLTALKKLLPNKRYTVNVALFVKNESENFKIVLGKYISIINKVIIKNLSYEDEKAEITYLSENSFESKISKGYSIIEFYIFTKENADNNSTNSIKYILGDLISNWDILIEQANGFDGAKLVELEKNIVCGTKENRIIKTEYISPYLLNRPDFKFIYICFDERYYFNNTQLCRLFSHFISGVDFQELDEISLRNNLYLCDYPEYFEDIILGIFNDLLSNDCLENGINKIETLLLYDKMPQNVMYIIENSSMLKDDQKNIMEKFEYLFSKMKKECFMIFQDAPKEKKFLNYNDNDALVGIFETGIKCEFIDSNNLINEELVIKDIDEELYFPSNKVNILDIKSFIINKKNKDIKLFFDNVINIVSKQCWSSRVLDFVLLLENLIPTDIFYEIVYRLRDIYYSRTDFNTAYHYSKILNRYPDSSIEKYIDNKYKEADELNHCCSILESKKIFGEVAEKILQREDTIYLNKGLEALTEVYNIRFWLLDVDMLEEAIETTICTYFSNCVDTISEERDLYPYYNCLNRKMVVQYLLGHYSEAEATFLINLREIKLNNYIAFAYMDSARGLYYKDIHEAYKRIKKAICYLKELFDNGKELRRYYDCLIEKTYVEFILAKHDERSYKIKELINAVYNIKKYGYKNILQKSYFKLAACFMVLGDAEKAKYYLEKIINNPNFLELPRNQLMYNELMKGYFHLSNNNIYTQNNIHTDFCNVKQSIEFNCFETKKSDKYFIETRLW